METNEYATLESLEDSFWWYRGLHRLVLQTLASSLRELSPKRNPIEILDAGCGTGGLLRKLSGTLDGERHLPDGIITAGSGVDFSPHAVVRAAARTGRPIARASVEGLPYAKNQFDVVVSLDVLYHRGVNDDRDALAEFRRVLRPGGFVLLNLPAYESLRSSHDAAIHTARRYRKEDLSSLLQQVGLEPVRVTYWNTILFPGLALVRRLRRTGSSAEQGSDVRPVPGWLNGLLESILRLERTWLRRFDFPFGLSLIALARVPDGKGE